MWHYPIARLPYIWHIQWFVPRSGIICLQGELRFITNQYYAIQSNVLSKYRWKVLLSGWFPHARNSQSMIQLQRFAHMGFIRHTILQFCLVSTLKSILNLYLLSEVLTIRTSWHCVHEPSTEWSVLTNQECVLTLVFKVLTEQVVCTCSVWDRIRMYAPFIVTIESRSLVVRSEKT